MTTTDIVKVPAKAWTIPEELGVPVDPLRIRLDFHYQAIELTEFEGDLSSTRIVSAMDIMNVLSSEVGVGSGLLPPNTLWWKNTHKGPLYAIYVEPCKHKVAVSPTEPSKPLKRYEIPLPGLIFLCTAGEPPRVYAVKDRPSKATDKVYKAPLLNMFEEGRSCPGNNDYPEKPEDVILTFFISYFSVAANVSNRSRKHPDNILNLWKELDMKNKFPVDDLMEFCTIEELMKIGAD
jgi:hypothetical protein